MTEKFSTEILEKIEWFNKNYAEIKENIEKACSSIGKTKEDVILLAATKTVPMEVINHAISSGIEYIGENRVQEFLSKKDELFYVRQVDLNITKKVLPLDYVPCFQKK